MRIILLMKKTFLGRLMISYLHCIESVLIPRLKDDETAVKDFYLAKTGKPIDLDNPKTFSEKMNWYKLNGKIPLMEKCADKVGVREYIGECGFSEHLNEVYGVYSTVSEIPFQELPDGYVLKASHGSHMSIIKAPGEKINLRQSKAMLRSWLRQNIYWGGREWVYKNIPRRIVAEKYLADETGELKDYKFFCFNGIPSYLQYDGGRFKGKHFRNYYDMGYRMIALHDDVQNDSTQMLPLPIETLDTMKDIACQLSKPFQFVRVDFYCVHGKIYIGELTFFHNGGITWFKPEKYDLEFGDKWKLVM